MGIATRIDRGELKRVTSHVVAAIDSAKQELAPFPYLRLSHIFPDDLYERMLRAMPAEGRYRRMSGRARTSAVTRTKLDLLPEFVRHLPQPAAALWGVVGAALCSPEVREAFRERLAQGLRERFGTRYAAARLYPLPILTRDVPGYRIGIHPDTRRKAITAQIYLPPDRSIEHVGTVFHEKSTDGGFKTVVRNPFSPNTGYAFAVGSDTYHSVDTVGADVRTRDSILLTYFVDETLFQLVQNRGKRFGNRVLNEVRSLARRGADASSGTG